MSHGGLQSGNPPAEVPGGIKEAEQRCGHGGGQDQQTYKPNFIYGVFGM